MGSYGIPSVGGKKRENPMVNFCKGNYDTKLLSETDRMRKCMN